MSLSCSNMAIFLQIENFGFLQHNLRIRHHSDFFKVLRKGIEIVKFDFDMSWKVYFAKFCKDCLS